jgi:hypothetical protein
MSQKTFNHAFSVAFEVPHSTSKDGADVTAQQMYDAILKRAKNLMDNDEMLEAVGLPDDTYEEDSDPQQQKSG